MIHNTETKTSVQIPYPVTTEDGIDGGRAFHHGRFIMSLRKLAQAESRCCQIVHHLNLCTNLRVTFVEGNGTSLLYQDGVVVGAMVKRKGRIEAEKLHAKLTVVSDGCFSNLRRNLSHSVPYTRSHFCGSIMTNCPQFKAQHAEIVLAHPSPILVYQIGRNETRFLVDIPETLPKDIKSYMTSHVCPQLPRHLQQPFLDAVDNTLMRSMPNSFMPPNPKQVPGRLKQRNIYC